MLVEPTGARRQGLWVAPFGLLGGRYLGCSRTDASLLHLLHLPPQPDSQLGSRTHAHGPTHTSQRHVFELGQPGTRSCDARIQPNY